MKAGMLKYKGYRATLTYDENDQILIGEVFGISDSLNFYGTSITELEESFHTCIDNYLLYCAQIGKMPEKEYTGSFNIRTTPILHEKAALYAATHDCSLNQVVSYALETFLQ